MHDEVIWQPLLTLQGVTDTPTIVQPSEDWLDIEEARELFVRVDLLDVGATAATLLLETSPSLDGPWTTLASIATAPTRSVDYYGSDANLTTQLQRYLRWAVENPADLWSCTFKIHTRLPGTPIPYTTSRMASQATQGYGGPKPQLLAARNRARVAVHEPEGGLRTVDEGSELQPWTYLAGSLTADFDNIVIASEDNWLDTRGMDRAYLEVECLQASGTGIGIVLETAMNLEGPWTPALTVSTAYTVQGVVISSEAGATNPIQQYVRWHVESTDQPWAACFRVNVRAPAPGTAVYSPAVRGQAHARSASSSSKQTNRTLNLRR